jgi:hypothetical protein
MNKVKTKIRINRKIYRKKGNNNFKVLTKNHRKLKSNHKMDKKDSAKIIKMEKILKANNPNNNILKRKKIDDLKVL